MLFFFPFHTPFLSHEFIRDGIEVTRPVAKRLDDTQRCSWRQKTNPAHNLLFPTPSPQLVSETALYLQSHWAPDRPSDYKSRYRLSSFFSFYPSCKIRPSARVLAPHAIIFFMPSYAIRIDRRRNMLSVVVVVLYGPLLVMRCCNVVKRMSLISTHSSGTYSWALASYFPSPVLHFSF